MVAQQAADGPWPTTLRRWLAGETGYAPDGAESFDDIRDRVLPVWHRLTTQHADRTLVVVAHGVVCKVLLLNLLPGLGVADWTRLGPIQNVAIHELIREDGGEWESPTGQRLAVSGGTSEQRNLTPPALLSRRGRGGSTDRVKGYASWDVPPAPPLPAGEGAGG